MSTVASTGGGAPASTGGAPASTGPALAISSHTASTGGFSSTAGSTGTAANDFKWNDGWRERLSAGDQKTLQRLGRFAQPEDIWSSYQQLEKRLSSGELKSAIPKDAQPAELTAWRKENGIPEKPEEYLSLIKFEDGTVIGDQDKPFVDAFLKTAHAQHMTPGHVKSTIEWYFDNRDAQLSAQQQKDGEIAKTTQDALRAAWPGAEYRANVNAVHSLLDQTPKVKLADGSQVQLKDLILGARLPNGVPIGSSPEALQWLAGLSRELNPAATVVHGSGTNQMQAIDDEISKLKGMMGNKQSEYWKGPKADELQKRYRDLSSAKSSMEKRAQTTA